MKRVRPKERVSPTEHIANTDHPELESAHIRTSGYNIVDVWSNPQVREQANIDYKKVKGYWKEAGKRPYTFFHNHPGTYESRLPSNPRYTQPQTGPSAGDVSHFLGTPQEKFLAVEQKDKKTGELSGYIYIKRKNNPTKIQLRNRKVLSKASEIQWIFTNTHIKATDSKRAGRLMREIIETPGFENFVGPQRLDAKYYYSASDGGEEKSIEALANDYGLTYKFVPVSADHPANVRLRESKLETSAVAVVSLISSIFFLSSNLTGNVIGSQGTSDILGVILFLVGVVGSFIYFKRK